MAISITQKMPRDGVTEHPWKKEQGFYVLGDPVNGAQKHHAKFKVKVRTLEEVVALLGRGFSMRMSRNGKRASLISPGSLVIGKN